LRLALADGTLEGDGALALSAGPLHVRLGAEGTGLELLFTAPRAPGLALRGLLPADPSAWAELRAGFRLEGAEATTGALVLEADAEGLRVRAEDLAWTSPAGSLF
jgi:hypothetical protein